MQVNKWIQRHFQILSKDKVGEEIFRNVESESKNFICLESELEIILPTPQPWL